MVSRPKKVNWQNPSGKTQIPCHFATSPFHPPFCVNNSRIHLTKRFMGHGGGYRSLHRPRSRLEHSPDQDGKPHHDQPAKAAKVCEKQKYSRHRRLRQRQDPVLCQTVHHADAQFLCHHRSQWLYYKRIEKGVFHKRRLLEEGRAKPWLRKKKSKSQPCMSVCQGTMNRLENRTPSKIKSYYVEGGFSHLIHMTAAHLW